MCNLSRDTSKGLLKVVKAPTRALDERCRARGWVSVSGGG